MNNSFSTKNNTFQKNGKDRIKLILKKISEKEPPEMATLSKLIFDQKKTYINKIGNDNESDLNPIRQNMDLTENKLLINLNEFKNQVIEFNKNEKNKNNIIAGLSKHNDKFSEVYKHLKRRKNKKIKESFIQNDIFFNIANKYLSNNKRLPNMSKNLFDENPLISDFEHIKQFFINKKGDSHKFLKYLEKTKEMAYRKLIGNHKLNREEKKHLEKLMEKEKPKWYIPPVKEIPILKNEISKTQFTLNCLIKDQKEDGNNKIENIKLILSKKNPSNGITSRNLNLTHNDNSSIDIRTNRINLKHLSIISSRDKIFNRKNSHESFIVSPLSSTCKSKTSKAGDYFNNNKNENNNLKANNLNSKIRNYIDLIYKKNNDNKNIGMNKDLDNSKLNNNKLELSLPKKSIDFHNFKFDNNIFEIEKKLKKHESLKELNLFIPRLLKIHDESNDNSKSKINKNINEENIDKNNNNSKNDFFKKKMSKIIQTRNKTRIKKESYENIEKLYTKALNLDSKSLEDQTELENHLSSSRGNISLNTLMSLKNTYYNILRIEKSFSTDAIKKMLSIGKNNGNIRVKFTDEENKIINKNKIITKDFFNKANTFRKVICEKGENNEE